MSKSALSNKVVKMLGLFSGLQMVSIICSVIKNKLVAIWLQASGVGMFGIYNQSIETISTLTDIGLRQSAVRDVAMAGDNPSLLARAAAMVRRWSALSGLLGALVISLASPLLAKVMFGNYAYCWGFVALSASMFLNSIFNGESALLQGSSLLKRLARGTLFGNMAGLAISIPMFYYWRENSVIPSIIAYSVANVISVWCVRLKTEPCRESTRSLLKRGGKMAKIGLSIAIATFITNLANLALMTWLNRSASAETVGFYQAGVMLVVRYVGLIFAAVSYEYYPRLCGVCDNPNRLQVYVNHETILLLKFVTPVVLLFLVFRSLIVDILYTPQFYVIIPFISLAVLSTPFKAISYCGAYTILARGDSRIYVLTEGIDAVVGLILNIVLYQYLGLQGIGLAYILWYAGYTIIIYCVYHCRYSMRYSATTLKAMMWSLLSCGIGWGCTLLPPIYGYIALALLIAAWMPYTLRSGR